MSEPLEIRVQPDLREEVILDKSTVEADLGNVGLRLLYNCGKRLGKCARDFILEASMEAPHGEPVIYAEVKRAEGKLKASAKDAFVTVSVAGGKGKGVADIVFRFAVDIEPGREGDWTYTLRIERKDPRSGARWTIAGPYTVRLRRLELVRGLKMKVYPSTRLYVGDNFKVITVFDLAVKTKYRASLSYSDHRKVWEGEGKGTIELEEELVAEKTGKLIFTVEIPEFGYRKTVVEEIEVLQPPRLKATLGDLEGEARLGEEPVLPLTLENNSPSTTVKAKVEGTIYSYPIKSGIEVPPGKSVSHDLTPGPLGVEALENPKALIVIVEEPGGFEQKIEKPLPKPGAPKVEISLEPKKANIRSDGEASFSIVLLNKTGRQLTLSLKEASATRGSVEPLLKQAKAPPGGEAKVKLHYKPREVGSDRLRVYAEVFAPPDRRVLEFEDYAEIEVTPSFHVKGYEVSGLKEPYILPGESVTIALELDAYGESPIQLELRSPHLILEKNKHTIYPGRNRLELKVTAGPVETDVEGVVLEVTDRVHSERVELPLILGPPKLEAMARPVKAYGGLLTGVPITVRSHNASPLKAVVKARATEKVRPAEGSVSVEIPPYGESSAVIHIIGLREGREDLEVYVEAAHGSSRRAQKVIVPVEIRNPLEVSVTKAPEIIYLPHPMTPLLEKESNLYTIKMTLRNASDKEIPRVEVNVIPIQGPPINCRPRVIEKLPSKASREIECRLEIPHTYEKMLVEEEYQFTINGFQVRGHLVRAPVERVNYIIAFYNPPGLRGDCPYPARSKPPTAALIPVTVDPRICGPNPTKWSLNLHRLLDTISGVIMKSSSSHWQAALARYLLVSARTGSSWEASKAREELLDALKGMKTRVGDAIVVPGEIWKAAILKVLGAGYGEHLSKVRELGARLFSSPASPSRLVSKGVNEIIIAAVIGEENRLETTVKERPSESMRPLLLAHHMIHGWEAPYKGGIAHQLMHDRLKNLIYHAVSKTDWIRDEESLAALAGLAETLKVGALGYELVAAAIIYSKTVSAVLRIIESLHSETPEQAGLNGP
ncbi:MAG: hypothetical protein F7C35_08135 [Desulfurococcales archaeon]|nr:hypothetical protein [Desulfurococcales archaeon]